MKKAPTLKWIETDRNLNAKPRRKLTLLDRLIALLEHLTDSLKRARSWWRGPKYYTIDLVKHGKVLATVCAAFLTWLLVFFIIPGLLILIN